MLDMQTASYLTATLDALISEANTSTNPQDIVKSVQGLKASLLNGSVLATADGHSDLVAYRPFVSGAQDNMGETPEAHDLGIVKEACLVAMNLTGRTRKAYYQAVALVYVFWRNANRFFLAEVIQRELGEKFSEKRNLSQTIRVCFDLKNPSGTAPEIVAANKSRNNAVSRANQLLLEVESHFKNHPLRLEDAEHIRIYLTNRDRMLGRTDAAAMAGILSEMTQPVSPDETPDDSQESSPDDGGEADGTENDGSGESDDDEDSNESDDTESEPDEQEPDAGEDGGDGGQDTVSNPEPSNSGQNPSPMSKAGRMLAGAPEQSLNTLLAPHRHPDRYVAICYRIESDGSESSIAAIPCDEAMISKFYGTVQAGGITPVMAVFRDVIAAFGALNVSARPGASAKPAAVFTIGAGGVLQRIQASDTETLGTVMVTIIPTTETIVPGAANGQFFANVGLTNVPTKAALDAVASNDALIRFSGMEDGFVARIAVPRLPDIEIPFWHHDLIDSRVSVPCNLPELASEVCLTPEGVRNLRDSFVVPFLKSTPAKLRSEVVSVYLDEHGLNIARNETNRHAVFPGKVTSNKFDSVELLAEDFVRVVDALARIVTEFEVSIKISSNGVVGIRTFTADSEIDVLIPRILNGTLERDPGFAAAWEPEGQPPVSPDLTVDEAASPEIGSTDMAPEQSGPVDAAATPKKTGRAKKSA